MKTRNILISAICAAVALSSCAGTDELDPSLYGTPTVRTVTPAVTGSTVEITISATASRTNFRECGFYYGTDKSLSDARNLTATAGETFSSTFIPGGYGQTYYWQAYLSNNGSEVRSDVSTVSSLSFPEYVKVSVPTVEVTSADAVAVTATVETATGILLTDRGVCYSSDPNPTVTSSKESSGPGSGVITARIEDLTLGETCHLRCYARQGDEVSYSQDVTVVPCIPPSVATSDITDITATTASCGGKVTSDGGTAVTAKGVVWSTSQNPTVDLQTKTNDGTGTGSFTSTLTELTKNTTYYVRAYATNQKGTSYGEQRSFTTSSRDAVDLGLSVRWASENIGAETYTDCGDYYAWGETSTKSGYSWSTYKWCNGSKTTMTKYCTSSDYGTVDNKTVLESFDDVAHVKWGGSWRMPTATEWQELYDNCTWTWTTISGVHGYKVTSKKTGYTDRWIFLPAAGFRDGTNLFSVGSYGYYWSSSLGSSYSSDACFCWFYSSNVGPRCNSSRYFGHSVRPVCD